MTAPFSEHLSERGIYRLEFFGSRMDEQGYRVREAVASHQ